jgi:hypothetical protein
LAKAISQDFAIPFSSGDERRIFFNQDGYKYDLRQGFGGL